MLSSVVSSPSSTEHLLALSEIFGVFDEQREAYRAQRGGQSTMLQAGNV